VRPERGDTANGRRSVGTAFELFRSTNVQELLLEPQMMDERHTLALFGWTIGGLVGLMFVLNALALASLQEVPSAGPRQIGSQAGQPAATPSRLAYEVKSKGSSP
jgi:hypothetical protein